MGPSSINGRGGPEEIPVKGMIKVISSNVDVLGTMVRRDAVKGAGNFRL